MSKFWEFLIKYLGIPLLTKLGEWIISEFKKWKKLQDIKREQKNREKAIEDAKTPEDIRTAHRNNKL